MSGCGGTVVQTRRDASDPSGVNALGKGILLASKLKLVTEAGLHQLAAISALFGLRTMSLLIRGQVFRIQFARDGNNLRCAIVSLAQTTIGDHPLKQGEDRRVDRDEQAAT